MRRIEVSRGNGIPIALANIKVLKQSIMTAWDEMETPILDCDGLKGNPEMYRVHGKKGIAERLILMSGGAMQFVGRFIQCLIKGNACGDSSQLLGDTLARPKRVSPTKSG